MCIPTFVDFFLFHFFFFVSLVFFFFSLGLAGCGSLWHFFFLLFPFVCQLLSIPSSDHFQFFFIRSLFSGQRHHL